MNAINRSENSKLEQERGKSALEEAKILFANRKYDGAVSRGYYAAFHYACAVLLSHGLEARSHRGLQRLFHLHFIKAKIFDEEIGVILGHAQKAREEADYYPEIAFSEKTAGDRLAEVENFVAQMRKFLKKEGSVSKS